MIEHKPQAAISAHLAELYNPAETRALWPRVEKLIQAYARDQHPASLDERDVLLITYGDHVRQDGQAPLRTLGRFLEQHLAGTVSGVHILPFYPSTSDDGFAVVDYDAVDPALGAWADIAHIGEHFDLMFDAVINHISASSAWFRGFLADAAPYRDYFIVVDGNPDLSRVVRPRALPLLTTFNTPSGPKRVWTTFSADQIDLNYAYPEVLLNVLEQLLKYAARGARFIRLDAVAYLWKTIGTPCIHLPQTHAAIRLMRAVLDLAAPGTMLITETNVPHADNIAYFGNGADEAHLVYNFALPPLVLHTFHTSNATALTNWVETQAPPPRDTAFFNFLASHDGIGVTPARGILSAEQIEGLVARTLAQGGLVSYRDNGDGTQSPYELNITYFDALSDPTADGGMDAAVDRFLCAQAIMLALRGVPGIYLSSLVGARNDRAAADVSGIKRRINRAKHSLSELEGEMNDGNSRAARVFDRYTKLLQIRRAHGAFHPRAAQQILRLDRRVFALLRTALDGAERIMCLHNVSGDFVPVSLGHGLWADLNAPPGTPPIHAEREVVLRPYQILWARQVDDAHVR